MVSKKDFFPDSIKFIIFEGDEINQIIIKIN